MTRGRDAMVKMARRVGVALDSAFLAAFNELLDPDVRWGATWHPAGGV